MPQGQVNVNILISINLSANCYVLDEFSEEEDAALMDAVRNHGTMSFHTIKKEMNSTRSTADLRRRYDNFLDPAIPDEERPHPRTSREYSQKPSRDKYPYYRVRVRQVGWI